MHRTLSKATLERLGRELLTEIGLKEPHVCLDHLHGFAEIRGRGWRRLAAPWLASSREALYVLAHEIGHWTPHTEKHRGGVWWFREDVADDAMEREAEQYAHDRLRELGVAVPRWVTRSRKRAIAAMVRHQLRTTTRMPDARAAHWAGVAFSGRRRS